MNPSTDARMSRLEKIAENIANSISRINNSIEKIADMLCLSKGDEDGKAKNSILSATTEENTGTNSESI